MKKNKEDRLKETYIVLLLLPYKTQICPSLEYCSLVWGSEYSPMYQRPHFRPLVHRRVLGIITETHHLLIAGIHEGMYRRSHEEVAVRENSKTGKREPCR